jgi:DNA-binding NarL/FixJ family response regulator
MKRRVLIVDDHAAFRASARLLLESEGFEVVGDAPDGGRAIVEARRLRPDIVLLDVQLPDIDGIEVATRLATLDDPPTVVLISSREAADYGSRLAEAPAHGFLTKADLCGSELSGLVTTPR